MSFPSPALQTHLALLGRWCPGHGRAPAHPACNLTAKSGRVLCRDCSDQHESECRLAAGAADG